MIGIIVAMNSDQVIGLNNAIPWRYKGDMARFKRVTMGSTVIMGRKTWESIPEKFRPLSGRWNLIVSESMLKSTLPNNTAVADSIETALGTAETARPAQDIWFIGGARIYKEAMRYAQVIDVTHVPYRSEAHPLDVQAFAEGTVFFPSIDESIFVPGPLEQHPDEPELKLQRFERRYGLKDNQVLQEAGSLSRTRKTS